MTTPAILLTERLLLRKPRDEDGGVLFGSCLSDPEVSRFLTWPVHRTVQETQALVQECVARWEQNTQAHWVVTLLDEREASGMVSLRLEPHANLSYFLAQRLWGNGFMTEAIDAVVGWALRQHEIGKVWAFCDCENVRSVRVLERNGFVCEGMKNHYAVFPNMSAASRDCVVYGKGAEG